MEYWLMKLKFLFIDIHKVIDRYILVAGEHALLWALGVITVLLVALIWMLVFGG